MNRPSRHPSYLLITWTERGEDRAEWSPDDAIVKARARALRDAGVAIQVWRTIP